ncbi:MAG: prepilin-type N-terminal cleavage/methylation domain-containing protein [Bacilli bacterium]|nr:prepilin-type N-terminal cleavage/methylation domain-containing protein [Bacilli bacterium]
MRKNNKGFTLIEVLVAITIMGIITVMALPGVQQLQSRNRERKYEKYGESLVSSAKLYVDSNEEDIFGYAVSGCADITFSELEAKALAKDYETNGITCVGNMTNADLRDDTFIHVEKKNNKYVYQPYITCTDKTGKIVYQTPDVVNRCENVSVGVQGNMTFNITAASDTERDKWTKTKQINVEIGSDAGLVPNNFSAYCLTKADNPDVCVEGSRQSINFGNALGVKSVKRTIDLTDLTGEFYFVLLASEGRIADLAGNQISENKRSNFTIKIDNTPPTITNITKAAPLFWGDLLYRLQVEFYDEPAGSKITRITYTYDTDEEQDQKCSINLAYHGDCTDIKSPYITTAFTVNRNVDVVMKVYDEAGNSASYKTHVD